MALLPQTYFIFTGFFPYLLFPELGAHQLTRCECALAAYRLSFLQTTYTLHDIRQPLMVSSVGDYVMCPNYAPGKIQLSE